MANIKPIFSKSSIAKLFSWRNLIYLYISIPTFLFFFWLKPLFTVIFASLFCVALYFILKDNSSEYQKDINLFTKKSLLVIFSISLIWCYLAGQGGFFYQSSDHYMRNGTFGDLIYHKWPVIYKNPKAMLVYYIGHWLFPALFGKLALFITGNTAVAWVVAKIALLFWSTLGIMLVFILLCKIFSLVDIKKIIFCCLFFVFFSGLDLLGIYLRNGFISQHLEWWADTMQYSSFTTCLFWVYNQCICAWVSTILFFYEKKVQNYAFIGLCLLITSPLPFVGLFPFLVCSGVYQLIKTEKGNRVKFFLHNMLSPQNVIVSLTVFPLVALYYICQNAVTNTTPSTFDINIYFVYTLILFYLLEFGLYVIAIFKDNKKSIYLWIIIVMLFICPFIKIGSSIDFCMRASIPSLVLLMLLVFKTFLKTSEEKKWVSYLIIVIFAFGTLTPTMEFLRAIKTVKHEKTILLECNPIGKTLEGDSRPNFMGDKYEETFFYKYLCKKNLK